MPNQSDTPAGEPEPIRLEAGIVADRADDAVDEPARRVEIDASLKTLKPPANDAEPPPGLYSRYTHRAMAYGPGGRRHNALLDVFKKAYDNHLGFHIAPRDLRTALLAAVSRLINSDPEAFRGSLVDHSGRRTIVVETMGEGRADFEAALGKLAGAIHANPLSVAATADHEGATWLDRLEDAAWCLDAHKVYYEFKMMTMCGFPFAVVRGSPAAWRAVAELVEAAAAAIEAASPEAAAYLRAHFAPVAGRLARVAAGDETDAADWLARAFTANYRFGSGQESDYDGWIVGLFPELRSEKGRPSFVFNRNLGGLSPAVTDVPITWRRASGADLKLTLEAGVFGAHAHADGSLEAVHGYRAFETDADPDQESRKASARLKDRHDFSLILGERAARRIDANVVKMVAGSADLTYSRADSVDNSRYDEQSDADLLASKRGEEPM